MIFETGTQIAPGPLRSAIGIVEAVSNMDGTVQHYLVFQLAHPTGDNIYMFDYDHAKNIAGQWTAVLAELEKVQKPSLIIPPQGLMVAEANIPPAERDNGNGAVS